MLIPHAIQTHAICVHGGKHRIACIHAHTRDLYTDFILHVIATILCLILRAIDNDKSVQGQLQFVRQCQLNNGVRMNWCMQ